MADEVYQTNIYQVTLKTLCLIQQRCGRCSEVLVTEGLRSLPKRPEAHDGYLYTVCEKGDSEDEGVTHRLRGVDRL